MSAFRQKQPIRANALAVGLLALPLVALTVAAVAGVLHFFAGLPWDVALVAGAILGPTDPVAFLTVARRLGVSPRLVGLLDGENLLNDFTPLVIYALELLMRCYRAHSRLPTPR
ncbi:cation:proton antiporter [Sinorhizobium sp. NFACC03]|uniref:cation:proton antiporter domain-containing protein n=1 Tax=Sinorhizobium sp. NFACC03 TaxID=1566295 RepID=UPI00088B2680|nr:cation:proton antiporter [Sinorhizobium sp. NFACC03]SDA61616.1 Sodium/hydrogen exchanger family protein [Sinorhizobium sp. NFACC03]